MKHFQKCNISYVVISPLSHYSLPSLSPVMYLQFKYLLGNGFVLHHEVRAVCRASCPGLPSSEGLCKSVGTEYTHLLGRLENTGLPYMPTACLRNRVNRSSQVGGIVRKNHRFDGRGQRKQSKEC